MAVFGLVWRLAPLGLPPFLHKYGGSIAWGAMVYFLAVAAGPARPPGAPLCLALTIAMATELSRLYHAPWLDVFRGSFAGALLLGRHFSAWNIFAYWIGIAAAAGVERGALPRTPPGASPLDPTKGRGPLEPA